MQRDWTCALKRYVAKFHPCLSSRSGQRPYCLLTTDWGRQTTDGELGKRKSTSVRGMNVPRIYSPASPLASTLIFVHGILDNRLANSLRCTTLQIKYRALFLTWMMPSGGKYKVTKPEEATAAGQPLPRLRRLARYNSMHFEFCGNIYWSERLRYFAHTCGNCLQPLTCDLRASAIWTEPIIARR